MDTSLSCDCCFTRRQCLRFLSAAALGGGFLRGAFAAPEEPKGTPSWGFIDPAKLRPRPKVRIAAAILRMPPPYWLGWPGTTYDLERHQKEYLGLVEESGRRLEIAMEIEPKPVQDEAGIAALINRVKAGKPDGLLVILQHMGAWGWTERLLKEAGVPLLVFAPVGTSFTGHVINFSRKPGVHVVSSLEWPAVEAGFRMVKAKRMFEESRILWIHSDKRNETVLDRLGTKVRAVPRKTFNELFHTVPANDEVRAVASDMRKRAEKIVEPTEEDSINSARAYITAKKLLQDEASNALSMDCLGMVSDRLVPTPPAGPGRSS